MYQVDPSSGDIVISGFEKGIGASPYQGLTDLKNVNIATIPGEASVAPSTTAVAPAPSQQVTAVSATASPQSLNVTIAGNRMLENGQAINIVSNNGISGLTTGTYTYYVRSATSNSSTESIGLGIIYGGSDTISFGTSGTATLSTIDIDLSPRVTLSKNYMVETTVGAVGAPYHWILDSQGRVWSDRNLTVAGSSGTSTFPTTGGKWTYTGNTVTSSCNGNGMVFYQAANGTDKLDGWIFIFRNNSIDYLKVISQSAYIATTSLAWVYGWKTLQCDNIGISHEAIVAPDGTVNYCDGHYIGQWYQNSFGTPFDPTLTNTYTFTNFTPLPVWDIAQCIAYVGSQILIGGRFNIIYPWDLSSNFSSTPNIFLPENNVVSIVPVKQNAYVFAGRRGRIYITNGSQADLWKKVPDHISGTVQPYLTWGGTAYHQDKLFFGLYQATPAAGAGVISSANKYGGLWAVDVDNNSLFLSNVLSDGVYTGYATGVLPFTTQDTLTGYGLYTGWNDSATSSGVDVTSNNPYTGGQSVVVSDMIPIGTLFQPITPMQFEYKLSMPLLLGESVQILVGSSFADYVNNTFTSVMTTTGAGSATSGTIISDNQPNTTQQNQWLLVKAILTSTATTATVPLQSYNRLTELRIKGATVRSSSQKQFSID